MVRQLRLGRHPLHPALVHFPVALWSVAAGADVAGWTLDDPLWWRFSFVCQALGLVLGALAMVAGFLDFLSISGDRARDTAVWHMLAMTSAWLLFAVSVALRGLPGETAPPVWASVAALAGFAVMAAGGWLGGKLVYGYGIGVEPQG